MLTWYSHDPHIHILHYLSYLLAAYTHGAYMRHVTHTRYTHHVTWLFTGPLLHHLHLVFSCNNTRHCNLLSSCGELVPIPPSPPENEWPWYESVSPVCLVLSLADVHGGALLWCSQDKATTRVSCLAFSESLSALLLVVWITCQTQTVVVGHSQDCTLVVS